MIQKPIITEGMHLDSVQRHRHVRRAIEDLCFSWGYRPVETPLLDEFSLYDQHMSTQLLHDSYRLIDRSGKVMLLRSDITLFLAGQLGRHMDPDELPLRISYADTIVRHQADDEIHSGDTFQAGAELIGVADSEGDAEILLLAANLFRTLQIPDTVLHIGSRKLLQLIWPDADAESSSHIAEAIRFRRFSQLASLTDGAKLSTEQINTVFSCIAEATEHTELSQNLAETLQSQPHILSEVQRIIELSLLVQRLEPGIRVRIDFSEVGGREYYSGMAFQMYCPGAARAVAGGGRYDSLLGDFGCPAASVGFSVVQSVIEPLVQGISIAAEPISTPESSDFTTRYTKAQEMRQQGKAAHL